MIQGGSEVKEEETEAAERRRRRGEGGKERKYAGNELATHGREEALARVADHVRNIVCYILGVQCSFTGEQICRMIMGIYLCSGSTLVGSTKVVLYLDFLYAFLMDAHSLYLCSMSD